ncbi:methylenetetrahydrofolate reductase [Gordonia terrae]
MTSTAPRKATVPTNRSSKAAMAAALRDATYEILPFKTAEEKVLAHVPRDVALTVTTTEAKGVRPTIDLAVKLSKAGYSAAPHIAARNVTDRAQLRDILDELADNGIDRLFCIGGDAATPAGDYPDALSMLRDVHDSGRSFSSIGIGGYPEGHALIVSDMVEQALKDKAPYATQILTQLCFDSNTTIEWARQVKQQGIELPIRVGIPGAIGRQKLIRVSASLGLGQSARFLKKQQNMFWRFFLPGGYSPNKLIGNLAPAFDADDNTLQGLHIFTFNELESTEAWRQRWLSRLG